MKNLFDYEKTQSATADLPFGAFKDESSPGQQDGTDIVAAHIQDIAYPLYQVLQLAGVTPNGELEDGNNKTQFIQALTNIGICRHSDKVVYNKSVFVWTILGNDFVLYRSIKDENSAELNDTSSWQKILEIGSDNVLKFAVDTNIELENSVESYLTNCILEIPQNIKYTLEDGTLTIKAGTIITVPYGTTDQSSTYPVGATFINNNFKVVKTYFNNNKFFVQAEVQADVNYNPNWLNGERAFLSINCNTNYFCGNMVNSATSGPTTPDNPRQGMFWYDTTNNYMKQYNNGEWSTSNALPLLIATGDNTGITAVLNVFNGMGYIGAAVFVLPGLKWIGPNGKNADGSNNNIEGHLDYVYTEQMLNERVKLLSFYSEVTGEFRDVGQGTIFDYVNTVDELQNLTSAYYAYVRTENQMYVNGARSGYPLCVPVARLNVINSDGLLNITDFQFNTTFLAADDQTVLHKCGDETIYGQKTFNQPIVSTANGIVSTGNLTVKNLTNGGSTDAVIAINSDTNKRCGSLRFTNGDGYNDVMLTAAKENADISAMGIRNDNGSVYAYCPTYTNYADSSEKIVTTQFLTNRWTTSRATTTSSASKARPAVVVTNYVSGASWYRIWSDGWIEQGGFVSNAPNNTDTTVTFLKKFSNTNYSALANASVMQHWAPVTKKTATSMVVYICDYGNKNPSSFHWRACGY